MRDEPPEGFLRRWSRQKVEARDAPPAPPAQPLREAVAEEPAPVLPPVEELTIDSDFKGFFHPKVGEDVRRSALRKLFSDPHFNVMDGLDTYIDDYSVTVPIPPEMLAGMRQAQRILAWAAETEEEAVLRRATPPALPVDDEVEAKSEADAEEVPGIPEVAASPPLLAPRDDSAIVFARSGSDEATPRRSDDAAVAEPECAKVVIPDASTEEAIRNPS